MGLLGRTVFLEIASRALLGATVFTFVLFLQKVSRLFEQLVRGSAAPETIAYLFSLLLPAALTFTIPVGVLVGTLIALSRMSADAEITAMRASGLSSRRLLRPVLTFAFGAMLITAATSMWLTPLSIRQTYKILNKLIAAQLTAEIQPRVFAEQFPDTILYVGGVDATPGSVVRWRNVFLADISAPEKRKKTGSGDAGDGPRITTASEAIAVPDIERNRIQLSLVNGTTHEMGRDYTQYFTSASPRSEQILEAAKRNEVRPRIQYITMDMGPLWHENALDARVELHTRLVLPPACMLLALIGVPLGLSSRKGGKSSAFVLTVIVAFLYYMALGSLINLARQGTLPVGVAMWLPNLILLALGLSMVMRMERPGDRDIIGSVLGSVKGYVASFRGLSSATPAAWTRRLPTGAQIIDHYVLTSFLFYFSLLLTSFVLMTLVYTFFELLSDILKNNIAMSQVAKYLFYLTPKLIYDSTPVSVLVAVLVTFGILTKNNEVTAMKACGVSLYRLAVPVFGATTAMSAGLFAFDHYIIPDANKTQDAIRAQIKGRPTQTYLRPGPQLDFRFGVVSNLLLQVSRSERRRDGRGERL